MIIPHDHNFIKINIHKLGAKKWKGNYHLLSVRGY